MTYAPPPHPAPAIAYYKQAFALYGNPSGGISLPERDCPIQGDGTIVTLAPGVPTPHGSGCILNRTFGASSKASDLYTRFRVDQNINAANRVWYAVKFQNGVQPDLMDPVNSVFNAYSSQPQTGVSIGYTHIFNPDLVNEFNPGFNWDRATYQPTNFAAARAASPFLFQGAGLDRIFAGAAIWPAGSDTTTWQLIDNLTWRYGAHTLKFGENLLRTLLSDHNLGSGTTPRIRLGDAVQYSLDVVGGFATQAFAPSLSEPFGFASLDLYAQDTWKVTRRLTFNYGLRATWNGNPVEQHSNFGQLASGFYDIPHDVNQPLNKVLLTGQRYEFSNTQIIQWQPRVAVAWQTRPHTVFRAGAGLFSDVFGSVLADNLMLNFPLKNTFFAGAPGTGNPIVATYAVPGSGDGIPGSPNNDGLANLALANSALVGGFHIGVLSCAASNAPANCIPAIGYFAFPKGTFEYPYFAEWSAATQQEFGRNWMLLVQYAGTRAMNMPYATSPNMFQTVCAGCFAPIMYDPSGKGPDGRFAGVTQLQRGATSIYHALQTTVEKRFSRGLFIQANYTWSHCIDEVSSEGLAFTVQSNAVTFPGRISMLRGNCDYDVRHSLNGRWVYLLPSPARNHFLRPLINGWEVDGNIFLHTGFPLSVSSYAYGAQGKGVFNGAGPGLGYGYAVPVPGVNPYAKWQKLDTQTPGVAEVQWLNPKAFTSIVDPNTGACTAGETFGGGQVLSTNDNAQTCQFATTGRNSLVGPGFFWTDFSVAKSLNVTERVRFRVGATFYNTLNHMNLSIPRWSVAGVPSSPNTLYDALTIGSATSPPTSLLGSMGISGDSSVRMIALSGKIEF